MLVMKFAVYAALVLGFSFLLACKYKDKDDERRTSSSNASQPVKQPNLTADEDEEDENPTEQSAPATENAAPLQTLGHQFSYNFDSDSVGQLPRKFHSAITGSGKESKWIV